MEKVLRERIDPELTSDLEAWCDFMLANFDERAGFLSDQAEVWANDQYESLARRLRSKNLVVTTDKWWS